MPAKSPKAVKIFYCYAHEDRSLRDELEKHLDGLSRLGKIRSWYDREILAGERWEREINAQLSAADIVLLLISPDFMHSDYCWGIEMKQALQSHEQGKMCVIPILLRPVFWKGAPFGKLQLLPTGGKAITSWLNRDEAFEDVTSDIARVVDRLLVPSERQPMAREQPRDIAKLLVPSSSQLKSAYIGRFTGMSNGQLRLTGVSQEGNGRVIANMLFGEVRYACEGTASGGLIQLTGTSVQPILGQHVLLFINGTIFSDGHLEGTIIVAGEEGVYNWRLGEF